jgi:O-antigen ligase
VFWLLAAATLPSALAFNVSPSPTFLNQALAFALWGAAAAAQPTRRPLAAGSPYPDRLILWLLSAALALAAWAAWALDALPLSLAASAWATLLAAGVLAATAWAAERRTADALFAAFAWAWLIAGTLNVAIAAIQVFAPALTDGTWIATSGIVGRAVGNLRQPNHLSSLLLWSCIATVALLDLRRLSVRWAAAAMAAFVFAVVLTASRTGLVSVLLLAVWGFADRRLSRQARGLLLAAPLIYALAWFGMAQWAALSAHTFGGTARLAESDISSSRFGIWANTLSLIRMHPWAGVGLGNFNFAWTLTPFPGRPTAFFDHTHNLPLQLAVELGLPLAALVMGLLLGALGLAGVRAWRAPGDDGTARRCAVLMVLMIGLHSLLEYPLWYAYFLLPTAWALGFALRPLAAAPEVAAGVTAGVTPDSGPDENASWPWLRIGGFVVVAGSLFAVWDYSRVTAIFSAQPGSPPLEARIARGQRSVFFAHHANYAAVTSGVPVADPAAAFGSATHYLLDTRLMIAWARSLADRGHVDAARHIAARLREFRRAGDTDFFAACPDGPLEAAAQAVDAAASAPAAEPPFQCQAPRQALSWKDFERQP